MQSYVIVKFESVAFEQRANTCILFSADQLNKGHRLNSVGSRISRARSEFKLHLTPSAPMK